jgi:hypothetical protein
LPFPATPISDACVICLNMRLGIWIVGRKGRSMFHCVGTPVQSVWIV